MEEPVLNIVGERVALGPLRRDLAPLYQRWVNDFETVRAYGQARPYTLEEVERWLERAAGEERTIRFTVYERSDGGTWRPIGKTGLYDVDFRNRRAEFGILIGEPDARGRGYGAETARLMLDYAFTALGLHSVMLEVAAYNEAGLRAYRKAGFREFGRRREAYWFAGRWWDKVYMDCLASEFESPVLGRIFQPDQPRPPRP
ncbi:MAG: GNAT family N-acetyltransferase [Thermomicrobiaceae bacterium]|nr:GNAT family N-acetyltransferase [Thermomicrobiaceae bacterium]